MPCAVVARVFELISVQIDFHFRIIRLQFSRIPLPSKIPSSWLPLKISFNLTGKTGSYQAIQKKLSGLWMEFQILPVQNKF